MEDPADRARLRDKVLVEHLHESLPRGSKLEAVARILFLLSHHSHTIGKERVEQLVRQIRPIIQELSIGQKALRDTVRMQGLLVFAHPEESLQTLPLLLTSVDERRHVLDRVVELVPELQTADGEIGEFWRQLHRVLEQPLPSFALPGVAQAATEAPVDGSGTTNARKRATRATPPAKAVTTAVHKHGKAGEPQ